MSQYTKSGFSKPFACCGHWKECEMGFKFENCFYKKRDTETMQNCIVYQNESKKIDEVIKIIREGER